MLTKNMTSLAILETRLAAIVVRLFSSGTTIRNLRRLTGGASRETWAFEAVPDGKPLPLILRRAFGGDRRGEQAIALENEALLVRLAHEAGVPVPKIHYVLQPQDELGSGFIAEFVDGETLGGKIVSDERFSQARRSLAFRCGEVLATIHRIPATKLAMLANISTETRLEELYRRYRSLDPRPVFSLAFKWLREHIPPYSPSPRLVHGDFRNGNLLVGTNGLHAVLDWELAHVGDPVEDLGWICVGSWRFGKIDKPVGGFGTREDLLAGYRAGGGNPPGADHLRFWEVFGSLNWGLMCATMTSVFRSGLDSSVERAMIARRASETEIDLLTHILPQGY